MIKKVETTQVPEEPHVLTKKEASKLLLATNDYFSCISGEHVDGRHRTEVIAKTMELDGLFDQASDLISAHKTIKEFADGDAKSLKFFTEMPFQENIATTLKNTKYLDSVMKAIKPLVRIEELLDYREIDWEKSAKVISEVKKERFPKMLTMVEKLSNWQRDQSPKGHSER